VAREIGERGRSERETSPGCVFNDVHLASSCLQKALRRGEQKIARTSALYLLSEDPERLWRRLVVCAFEDFGLVDLEVTAKLVAVATSKPFRLVVGERALLLYLIECLSGLAKDRRLDDLYALGRIAQRRGSVLQTIQAGPLGESLAGLVHQTTRLIQRCERLVPHRSFRALVPKACEQVIEGFVREGRIDGSLAELVLFGLRKARDLLPLLLPLVLEPSQALVGQRIEPRLPTVPLIAGVPAYAIDGFTRSGRVMLELLARRAPFAAALQSLDLTTRSLFLRHLLFFAEGGRCRPLWEDPLSATLRHWALLLELPLEPSLIAETLALVSDELPLIHALRDEVLAQAKE